MTKSLSLLTLTLRLKLRGQILSPSHSSDQIHGDGGALSNSHSLATKITHSSSRKMPHTSNKVSTHSCSHGGGRILSPSHSQDQTTGDGGALSNSHSHSLASKITYSPSCKNNQVSTHSHSHGGGQTLSLPCTFKSNSWGW